MTNLGEGESKFSVLRVFRQVRDELLVSKMVIISIFELPAALQMFLIVSSVPVMFLLFAPNVNQELALGGAGRRYSSPTRCTLNSPV